MVLVRTVQGGQGPPWVPHCPQGKVGTLPPCQGRATEITTSRSRPAVKAAGKEDMGGAMTHWLWTVQPRLEE